MSQRDYVLISVVHIPEIWNESEDVRRDLVDWGMSVPPRPDQVEDLESLLLKHVDLEGVCERPLAVLPICSLA